MACSHTDRRARLRASPSLPVSWLPVSWWAHWPRHAALGPCPFHLHHRRHRERSEAIARAGFGDAGLFPLPGAGVAMTIHTARCPL